MRSMLYVPGDQPEKLAKAAARGADALIVDLEDAVPVGRKAEARATVAAWLRERPRAPVVWVRVNADELLGEDVAAIAGDSPDGVYLPKCSSVAEVDRLVRALGEADVPVCALLETAAGILDARAIASHPRVTRLAIGEADLSAELGIDPSPDERELAPMRAMVVLASAAAHLEPPVGPISTDFADLEALRASTVALKRMGFGGRAAIHPAQVAVINEVFTPTPDEVTRARELLERFEASGGGVVTGGDGRMVDEAIVRAARRTLAQAG
ncbi:MAG TPA: CoA ester lyase [Actinomycetota bacterium]